MSHTSVPDKTKLHLWVRAGGRCQYRGCNKPLWRDDLTDTQMNAAYVAHIVADSPGGPRGDEIRSEQLKQDLSNLMLLCDPHHRLVDREGKADHSESLLKEMKREHEARIETLTAISPDISSHVLLYGANIGDHSSMLTYEDSARAMVPKRYPASATPIRLDMIDSGTTDRAAAFWSQEEANLLRKFDARVRQVVADGTVRHMSVFARAPQPLLIRLGTLLTDIAPADIYQMHREPNAGWMWPAVAGPAPQFRVSPPAQDAKGPAALVIAISGPVTTDRITAVLGEEAAIWRLEVHDQHHDCISTPEHLSSYRTAMRHLLERVKVQHGGEQPLNIFPFAPLSTMVELGRVRQPKAAMRWRVFDENRALGGFVHALDIAQE